MRLTALPATALWLLALCLLGVARAADPSEPPEEPPAPAPSTSVQKLFDENFRLIREKKLAEALAAMDRALAISSEAHDPVSEAWSHGGRGWVLEFLGRED